MEADSALRARIMRRGIAHDGDENLRRYVRNADRKTDSEERSKLRIVKRSVSQHIDLVVALSMACDVAAETLTTAPAYAFV